MRGKLFNCYLLPICVLVLLVVTIAPPVLAGTISFNSFNSWGWGGFSGSDLDDQSWWNSSDSTTQEPPEEPPPTAASLSGFVYLDVDPDDGAMNTFDWTIPGATLALFLDSNLASPLMTTMTDMDGSYVFDEGFLAGSNTYTISLITHSYAGQPHVGNLGGTADKDNHRITDILLAAGDTGTSYNFAEFGYPIDLVSKRLLMDKPPPIHAPEPGSLVLLAVGGLVLGALAAIRCRRRKPQPLAVR